MKKIIGIFVLMLMIATTISPVVNCIKNETNNINDVINDENKCYMDELDQYQTVWQSWYYFYQYGDDKHAYIQSFKPSYPTLTRVSIYLDRSGDPFLENGKIQIAIKSKLDPGYWMTSVDLTESDIPEGSNWIDVDLDDIQVEPERTYYLLVKPVNILPELFPHMYIGAASTSPTDLYTRGDAYINRGDPNEYEIWESQWIDNVYHDLCFKTYGIPNTPPNNPVCYYDQSNDELVITGFDPDDDNIRYGVSWNDNLVVDTWTDFVAPGTERRIDCERRKNPVGIISEDIYGDQSQWSSVTPKIKTNMQMGQLGIYSINGGFGVEAVIDNNGNTLEDVLWRIEFEGLVLINRVTEGIIEEFPDHSSLKINTGFIFGLSPGFVRVNVWKDTDEVSESRDCIVLGPIVILR